MALDEATQQFLGQMAANGGKPLEEMTPAEARGLGPALAELYGAGPDVASSTEHEISCPDGETITARLIIPTGPVHGLILYFHGGGWVIGSTNETDTLARELATRSRAAVMLVEYRLAPEYRYPTAVEDAWTALQWAHRQVRELVGARVPLIVAGESAGGNLATVVARRARDAGIELALQVLIYPVIAADFDTATYTDPENELILTRNGMIWFWDHYAPDPAARLSPDASPLATEDLAGLAPALVVLAEHDVLRQEGEQYAEALRQAGVPVELRLFEGQMHMFFMLVNVLPGSAAGLEYVSEHISQTLASLSESSRSH